jgi:peptidoglycan/xylan/chitin deacetylase (PgdA/CDA1 family)
MRAILTYHSIDGTGSPISVSPTAFRRHVEWLASGRVRVVRLDELLRVPPGEDAVALTFDDAFVNFAEEAAPLLREYSLPCTVFVVAGRVGQTNAWGGRTDPRVPTLPLLDWNTLALLDERGVRLGAHTRTHPLLTRVPASQLDDELRGAAETMKRETGRFPEEFAYPYGDVNPAVASAVQRIYARACTTQLRVLRVDDRPELLPRLDMFYWREPGRLEAWGTAGFQGRLWVRAQARRLRSRLASTGAVPW